MTEPETAEKPTQEGGDAAAQTPTAGTPAEEVRNAQDENIAKLNLEWKAKAERTNELERENAELRAHQAPSPAATDARAANVDEDGVDWSAVENFARQGDPVAKAQIATKRSQDTLIRELANVRAIDQIPDAELRKEAADHFAKNRHRLGDPQAAIAEVSAKKLATENERLKAELAKAAANQPVKGVNTSAREVPASEHKVRVMTLAELEAEVERTREERGDNAARALRREVTNGTIRLK